MIFILEFRKSFFELSLSFSNLRDTAMNQPRNCQDSTGTLLGPNRKTIGTSLETWLGHHRDSAETSFGPGRDVTGSWPTLR
jgi:hypothetical protein